MFYAAICAIVKDELEDIHEWIWHHLAIGFEHILIYDNNSKVPLKRELASFTEAGLVTVLEWPLTGSQQLSAYMHAIGNWGSNACWMAFIDIDEFIVPLQNADIRDFLDDYLPFGGVCANWRMFGSNGHISRPGGGVMENYTCCLGLNNHIKSIVRPEYVRRPVSAHHFTFAPGHWCVNEDKVPVRDYHTYALADRICINHYYYKSQQDFYAKIARGLATQIKSGAERRIEDFYSHLRQPCYYDDSILRFKPVMTRLSRIGPAAAAQILHGDMNMDLCAGIEDAGRCLEHGRTAIAWEIYKKLSRYYSMPELHILGANAAFIKREYETGLNLLRREMSRPEAEPEILRLCYQALGNYYALTSKPEEKLAIDEYLD